jgi:hypothetical protein
MQFSFERSEGAQRRTVWAKSQYAISGTTADKQQDRMRRELVKPSASSSHLSGSRGE